MSRDTYTMRFVSKQDPIPQEQRIYPTRPKEIHLENLEREARKEKKKISEEKREGAKK